MSRRIPSFKIHAVTFSLIVSLYFFLCMNIPLLSRLFTIAQSDGVSAGFAWTLPIFLIAFFNLIFVPFSNNAFRKPLFIALIMISAGVSYATYNYGIIFNREMIGSFFETNKAEAYSYFNASLAAWILCFGIIPALFVWKTEIISLPRKKIFLSQLYAFISSMLVISLIAAVYYQDYVITLRNHTDLKRVVVPTYALASGVKYAKQKYFTTPLSYTRLGEDAHITASHNGQKKLTVVIVGETARAHNYSLNGYAKDTNKFTRPLGVGFFANTTSCGTETSVSVPCMFSNLTRQGYSLEKAEAQDNVIDVLHYAGVETVWLENNGGCKGVCRNTKTIDIRKAYADDAKYCGAEGCYDGAMVVELKKQMAQLQTGKDAVIFLHLMGSHGPAYYKRYPSDMALFQPDCRRSDIQNCTSAALENTYDNTIAYTDKLIAEVIGMLKDNNQSRETALLYLSDHGESLGENGLYLHGLPYGIAPEEQKRIPMMAWLSPASEKAQGVRMSCLESAGKSGHYSQDNFFHTVLGLAHVKSQVYSADMDILNTCRKGKIASDRNQAGIL